MFAFHWRSKTCILKSYLWLFQRRPGALWSIFSKSNLKFSISLLFFRRTLPLSSFFDIAQRESFLSRYLPRWKFQQPLDPSFWYCYGAISRELSESGCFSSSRSLTTPSAWYSWAGARRLSRHCKPQRSLGQAK